MFIKYGLFWTLDEVSMLIGGCLNQICIDSVHM